MRATIDSRNGINLEQSIEEVNKWWIDATSMIYKENRLIYCVNIDGRQWFSDYEKYIVLNYKSIQEIDIITKNKQESVIETKASIETYLERFIPAANEVADHFYSEMDDSSWSKFSQFVEGLNWLVSSIEFVNILEQTARYDHTINQLQRIIQELNDSLENQEFVLTGDLIKYEILPLFEETLPKEN